MTDDQSQPLSDAELDRLDERANKSGPFVSIHKADVQALIAQARLAVRGEGMVTVPLEPNEEMIKAAYIACKVVSKEQGRRVTRFPAPDFVRDILRSGNGALAAQPADEGSGT